MLCRRSATTAQTLANEGRQIGWVDDFLRQLSDRAEQLLQTIVHEDARQPLEEFSQQLQDLVVRARRCVELDQLTRDETVPQLAACEQAATHARHEIGRELDLSPEQILRETGADPDQLISSAHQQLVSAKASLDRGAFIPAEASIKEVEHLIDETQSVVSRTRKELQEQPARRAELSQEASRLANEVNRCQRTLAELKREFCSRAARVSNGE